MYRLMTFPLITIAAVNGHGKRCSDPFRPRLGDADVGTAFAGGMVMALACDYRIMTTGKGLMCMNEVCPISPSPNVHLIQDRTAHKPRCRLARRCQTRSDVYCAYASRVHLNYATVCSGIDSIKSN